MKRNKIQLEVLIKAVYRHWKKSLPKSNYSCPSEEILACFVDVLLSKKEEERVKRHLKNCNKCMDAVLIAMHIKCRKN